MYADDTHISLAANNVGLIQQNLNEDLANINRWLVANKLTLNSTKMEFIMIGSRQRLATLETIPHLAIEGIPIKQVHDTRSLGVQIDETLQWDRHIDNISKTIAAGISAIKRCRACLPNETLILLFNAVVKPHFDYCDIVWGNCSNTLASKLQKLQNRAARILTYSSYDTPTDTVLKKLGWSKLHRQRDYHLADMVFKSINGLAPTYLQEKCIDRKEICKYSIRDSSNKLSLPLPRTNYLKNSYSYKGAVLWNSLPSDTRAKTSINDFRTSCKKYIL